VRRNMRERLLSYTDKLLLRKRALIESIHDQLKNVCQIEHSRHRSPYNFLVHLFAGWAAYCHQPKKPALHLRHALQALPVG
jgi:DDE family transposase